LLTPFGLWPAAVRQMRTAIAWGVGSSSLSREVGAAVAAWATLAHARHPGVVAADWFETTSNHVLFTQGCEMLFATAVCAVHPPRQSPGRVAFWSEAECRLSGNRARLGRAWLSRPSASHRPVRPRYERRDVELPAGSGSVLPQQETRAGARALVGVSGRVASAASRAAPSLLEHGAKACGRQGHVTARHG
jgi:hypothetical protein